MAGQPLIDVDAVAQRLGTTVRHVRQLVTDQRIPYKKVGRLLRFDPDEIDSWVHENSKDPVT